MVHQPDEQPVVRDDMPIDRDQGECAAESGHQCGRHRLIKERHPLQGDAAVPG